MQFNSQVIVPLHKKFWLTDWLAGWRLDNFIPTFYLYLGIRFGIVHFIYKSHCLLHKQNDKKWLYNLDVVHCTLYNIYNVWIYRKCISVCILYHINGYIIHITFSFRYACICFLCNAFCNIYLYLHTYRIYNTNSLWINEVRLYICIYIKHTAVRKKFSHGLNFSQ